jgi:RHH-type transcriptional regulator, rel operon repressor / antitoxin RelB
MLALRLPKEIEDRLTALAKATGRTKSYYARRAILNYFEDLEDMAIAEERLNDPNAEWLSLEEVYAQIALDRLEKPQQAAE